MRQVYDYERGQWVWRKDAGELEYERAVRQEIDRANQWSRRRAGEESSYYGTAYDRDKFRRDGEESSYYGTAYDRDKNFRNFRRDGEESSYYGPAYDRDKKFRNFR